MNNDLVKIFFELDDDAHNEVGTESLWAQAQSNNLFKIDNIPFYVYGVSSDDLVEINVRDNNLFFSKVVQRSGHSTLRVFLRMTH